MANGPQVRDRPRPHRKSMYKGQGKDFYLDQGPPRTKKDMGLTGIPEAEAHIRWRRALRDTPQHSYDPQGDARTLSNLAEYYRNSGRRARTAKSVGAGRREK